MSLIYHKELTGNLLLSSEYKVTLDWLLPNSTILELGSHTGYFSQQLINKGHYVTGIEYDSIAAQYGRDKGLDVITGDVEQAETFINLTAKFDYIIALNILEHLKDPISVLENLHSYLKQDGKIIIAGPNVACWWVRRNLLLGQWNYTDTGIMDRTHLRFFTAQTWHELAEASHYKVNSFAPTSFATLPGERFLSTFVSETLRQDLRMYLGKKFYKLFATVFVLELSPKVE